tara:strand:+ start:864 stop:1334 length:471 start_codon:yes stop_codon:yes gene_type:complete
MAEFKETQVYLMQDTTNNFYKIGRSKKPRYRERTLQAEKPTIELLLCFVGCCEDEKYLHDHFKEKRIRGEWFNLDDDDVEFFKQYAGKTVKPWDDCYSESYYGKYDLKYDDEGKLVFAHSYEERHNSEKPEKFKFYEWGSDEYKEAERERIKNEHG